MKKIWAPWRSQFIYNRKAKGCIFCKAAKSPLRRTSFAQSDSEGRLLSQSKKRSLSAIEESKNDKKYFVVGRSKFCFSILNIYPYNNGHLMIAPYRHKASLLDLNENELRDLMLLAKKTIRLIDKNLKPQGYNMGFNIGRIAGAGFAGHVHMHIVPRWQGDTNFMPVLSHTKVMSESLDSLYRRLKSANI